MMSVTLPEYTKFHHPLCKFEVSQNVIIWNRPLCLNVIKVSGLNSYRTRFNLLVSVQENTGTNTGIWQLIWFAWAFDVSKEFSDQNFSKTWNFCYFTFTTVRAWHFYWGKLALKCFLFNNTHQSLSFALVFFIKLRKV